MQSNRALTTIVSITHCYVSNVTFVLIGGDRFETLAAHEQIPGSVASVQVELCHCLNVHFFVADRLIVMLSFSPV